ncbi:hypothetical protein BJX96DRAFT_162494 [Aspergillus floccosus]
MYYLNFSTPFDTTKTNLTGLFGTIAKSAGPGNNVAPNYLDGAMFSNNDILMFYGGMLTGASTEAQPYADQTFSYELFQYGAERANWAPGPWDVRLDNGVMNFITNGAGVSAPSENLGVYFSGVHEANWGSPEYSDPALNATSNTMVTVDMSSMRDYKWTNKTLPDYIRGRTNAEAVWLPVGSSGIVVIIGGVTDSVSVIRPVLSSDQEKESNAVSPSFMESVAIYDIAGDKWYLQNTTGDTPPKLTQFCSVYARAEDSSSYNIYIYGGYGGVLDTDQRSDDVYVLSLPSFEWVKLYSGHTSHGRSGHKCVTPYPDQMFVLGGKKMDTSECLDGGLIQVFNLNTGKFQNTYDPTKWSDYKIPDLVTAQIGGSSTGGATKTAPDSWTNSSLADVFKTKYTKSVPTFYPYESASSGPTPSPVPGKKSSFPGWAGAIIGVVLGLLLIAGALLFWCLRYRRRAQAAQPKSEISERRSRIMGWVLGVPKSGETTVSAGDTAYDGEDSKIGGISHGTAVSPDPTTEAASEPVHEMPDPSTSPPVELPTSFNNQPLPSPTLSSATTSHADFASPISPGTPDPESSPTRPGHNRQVSSVSSSHSFTIANVLHRENSERHPHRPSYVSDVSEVSVGSDGPRQKNSRADTSGLERIDD